MEVVKVREQEWPEANIFQVPYWDIDKYWKEAAPLIQKAIAKQDEWTLEAVYRKLVNSDDPLPMQLWYIPNEFAVVTQIQTYPTGIRKCLLFLAGGENLEKYKHQLSDIQTWAKKYRGCHKMIIYGRKGWVKALDFNETMTIMEKEI